MLILFTITDYFSSRQALDLLILSKIDFDYPLTIQADKFLFARTYRTRVNNCDFFVQVL